jgi:8-oxo-dGTP diphosphatase
MTDTMASRHSVSVAAIVVNDEGQVLVTQRRDNGHWEPPGGILETHESIIDGVKREVLEETGFAIEALALTGVYKNMIKGVVALVFRAQISGGIASTSVETSRVEWWTPQMVSEHMDEAYSVRVLDALRHDGPAVRAHDGLALLAGTPALPR